MNGTCHDVVDDQPVIPGVLTVALAGNPNSGKTTLFNALTGLKQKVANYPGVTVEKKTGRFRLEDGTKINLIDLPGTYSLISRSPDEVVAMEVLRGLRAETPKPDAVIVVVDASNLQRNLYLVSQLVELGMPLVVALNMTDIAQRRGIHVSADRLSNELDVPVVPVVGNKHVGILPLKEAIRRARVRKMPDWPLPIQMKAEIDLLATLVRNESPGQNLPVDQAAFVAERLLIGDHTGETELSIRKEQIKTQAAAAIARLNGLGIDPMQADIEAHYHWVDTVAAGALEPACAAIDTLSRGATLNPVHTATVPLDYETKPLLHFSEKLDRILIHKVWGLVIFAVIMASLFVSIFWLAAPIMDWMQKGITWTGHALTSHLGDGPLKDLINDGIFGGVGTVLAFLPQIALLFFFLAILEDSGYLARAAFLMDRLLSKVGLHGKSFIPLLSSFACAIPGIMATRTIENRKDRLATILVAPFMSCSARLPVYTLLIGTFFATLGPLRQAGIMLACYVLGIVAAVVTAIFFKRSFLKGMPSSFILEMPTYKWPQASIVARQVWSNSSQFVKKAGTIILAMSVVLWALAYYPRLPSNRADAVSATASTEFEKQWAAGQVPVGDPAPSPEQLPKIKADALQAANDNAIAAAQSEYSIAGRFGHAIEPVIRPLGYNWKMGVGLVAAFAARETFVSTEGIVYSTGSDTDAGTQTLATAMQRDHYTTGPLAGKPVWTPLVAISLLIWFVLAMQCMSTVAIVKRETGGWGWPIFMTLYMNGLAYVVCLVVFQVGSHIAF